MNKFSAADVLQLPVAERLQLVSDIWDSIAEAPEALDLTAEDKRLIDERLAARLDRILTLVDGVLVERGAAQA